MILCPTPYKNSPGWLLGAAEGNTLKFSYDSKRWDRIKSLALRRDGYRCQLSKRYGRAVQAEVVHHIYPVEDYPEYAYCLWNLISLTRARHNELHDRKTNALTESGKSLMRRTKVPGKNF